MDTKNVKVTDQDGNDLTEDWISSTSTVLSELREPMDYKWKVQTSTSYGDKHTCSCVAYIDARHVQDRLDYVVGPSNWQNKFRELDGNLYCSIGIKINGEWIWKEDIGTQSDYEKDKGQASDAFKRAAVHWGIGRFLYSLGIKKVPAQVKEFGGKKRYSPIDEYGKIIYDLTKHFNKTNKTPLFEEKKKNTSKSSSILTKALKSTKDELSEDILSKVESPDNSDTNNSTPMPSDFISRVKDKQISDVVDMMFLGSEFNTDYLIQNKVWIKSLSDERKLILKNCVPEKYLSEFIKLLRT